jgi:hypothetical protein
MRHPVPRVKENAPSHPSPRPAKHLKCVKCVELATGLEGRKSLLALAALLLVTGCATLGGTTRRFENADMGRPVVLTSQRVPAEDRFEVRDEGTDAKEDVRVHITRARTCRVRNRVPRAIVTTTTRRANRVLFGAEVTVAILGTVITGAALGSAAKACPNGNPDTCDVGKTTALLAAAATAPFLVSTLTDIALTGGNESSRTDRSLTAVESDRTEECGSEPAAHVHASLVLPNGEEIDQVSTEEGEVIFELNEADRTRLGPVINATILVEGVRSGGLEIHTRR